MNCTHCGKRLTRKSARQIEGVVMCSTCMFAPRSKKNGEGTPTRSAETTGSVPEGDGGPCGVADAPEGPAS